MGSWRKVGAFLGLVPDEGRRDDYADDYAEADRDDYEGSHHRDYPADGYRSDDYRTDDYRGADYRGSDHRGSDYRDGEYGGQSYDREADPRRASTGYVGRTSAAAYQEPVTQGALAMQARPDLRREPEPLGAVRPITVKLNGFGEARMIGEKYREGKPVILDMTDMEDADARRLVDFAAGLAFALRGSIDKVTTKVFMLMPPDADVAEASEETPTGFSAGFAHAGRGRPSLAGH